MNISLEPGVYVVAVSGGVDSMVLLDLLAKQGPRTEGRGVRITKAQSSALSPQPLKLIIAHYDHGIRQDSHLDRELVQKAAEKHGLPFIYDEGRLGERASEEKARNARYKFLRKVQKASGADAIITAHHQDDLLETAILNLLRGTNRKGLSSLASSAKLQRPLLDVPKKEVLEYAKKHNLKWREDPTNTDTKYRRNFVRHNVIHKLGGKDRQNLVNLLDSANVQNKAIDSQIAKLLKGVSNESELDRKFFASLPHAVALEIMAAWLRQHSIRQFDKKLLEKLVVAAKSLAPGKESDINSSYVLKIKKASLALVRRER